MTALKKHFLSKPYRVHIVLYLIMILQGFIYNTPRQIFDGTVAIFLSTDLLITDYIAVAGVGAAFVNVALAGLLSIGAMAIAKHEPSGLAMATLGVVIAMAFFGKNPANMLPILVGGWLYAKYTKTPHAASVLPSVLATCLAPIVTRLAFVYPMPTPVGIGLGIVMGLFIGFIMTPFGAAIRKTHDGYHLYNVGLAAGILAVGFFAVFQTLGITQEIISNWSYGYNFELAVFSIVMGVYFILCGLLSGNKMPGIKEFLCLDAEGHDFYKKYGGVTYISMGLLALICVLFMFVVNGEYSGPVLGGLVSVVGFAAFGKSIRSSLVLMSGAMLAAVFSQLTTGVPFNHRGFLLAALFSTCLAPIATHFGWKWGLVAGFMHLSLATNVAMFHGGMNLYNNGFAGGLAAMILIPIIQFFKAQQAQKEK